MKDIVAVLYGAVDPEARADEKDVLVQVESISAIVESLGYTVKQIPVTLCLNTIKEELEQCRPLVAFNLVESIENKGHYILFIPSILDELAIPYTGCRSESIMLTSNKLIAKRLFTNHHIPTPAWTVLDDHIDFDALFDPPYIIKSIWEHASIGLDDDSVVFSKSDLQRKLTSKDFNKAFSPWFLEAYTNGREINISMIEDIDVPHILPPSEILFTGYPTEKPKIVGYNSKWEESSYEYCHTIRSFEFTDADSAMIEHVKKIAVDCWKIFGLNGYARIDFRVDADNRPWVLEVNANPCLSHDSGFIAAVRQSGLTMKEFVERIIYHAFSH
jgi:D-alanine-D-alanine ligase